MGQKKAKPKGWYLREQKKELSHKITMAKRWIAQCTDPDRLADLKEHLWRLEYREIFLARRKK